MLGLHCCTGFPLVVESGGYSLVVRGHLFVVASLAVEHRLSGTQVSVVVAPGLQSAGSIVVVHELICSRVSTN